MGFFDRLFRSKAARAPAPATGPASPSAPAPATPPVNPSAPPPAAAAKGPPPAIKVFDAYGRALLVPREEFRTKLLPNAFKKDWEDADALASTVMNAMNDGFVEDSLEPARQLNRIDKNRQRGASLLGLNLLRLGRFEMAEAVLSEAERLHGPSGPLLGNLAAAQAKLGHEALAAKTLQRALEIDPNFAFALNWLAAREKARGGEAAALAALRKVAARPGSWRAQLWLAQQALAKQETASALALHREVLEKTKEVPAEVLAQISGDLGKAGLASDVVALVAPRYVAAVHGLPTGNNLIQAYIAQKDGAGARRILAELYALPRPDWRETLLKLELAIDQVDRGYGVVTDPKTLEVTILVVERPLWMRDGPAFARLLPDKPADAVHVAFMSGSVLNPDTVAAKTPVAKPSDGLGRFARAVPIYLAEQAHLTTDARTSLLVPWLRRGGFVLSGRPWSPELLAPMNPKPDYLVLSHFDATQTPMQIECTLVRAIDEKPVTSFKQPIRLDDDFTTVRELTARVLSELATHADVAPKPPPPWLVPSSSTRLPAYCHGLEQALAVQCASQVPLNRPFLSGERNILDQLLDLTLREPTNVLARLLFLATLERESKLKSAIAAEYKEKAERLAREWKLNPEGEELAKEGMGRVVWE